VKYRDMDLKEKWRSKPGSSGDAKNHYDCSRSFMIERLTSEQQVHLDKFKFPILSEKSVNPVDNDLFDAFSKTQSLRPHLISEQQSSLLEESKSGLIEDE